jgi:hypothetical protein
VDTLTEMHSRNRAPGTLPSRGSMEMIEVPRVELNHGLFRTIENRLRSRQIRHGIDNIAAPGQSHAGWVGYN